MRALLADHIRELGLELFGIVALGPREQAFTRYRSWLERGLHGEMKYLERNQHTRRDPRELLQGASSAVVVGMPYFDGDSIHAVRQRSRPTVAQYARWRDYHKELPKRLRQLVPVLDAIHPGSRHRVCVDTAPMLERDVASSCSRGFIGKNTMWIHPQLGSYWLLAEILTTAALDPDESAFVDPATREQETGGCGTCKRCQLSCPTGALDQAYQLDASKCLAYHTIENRDLIPVPYWPWLRIYLFGCDLCQLTCPYNRHAKIPQPVLPRAVVAIDELDLFAILRMSADEYAQWFGGTALTRAKITGLKRNALIAMIVTEDRELSAARAYVSQANINLLTRTLAQESEYQRFLTSGQLHHGRTYRPD